jgi:uncharacterized membrane protein
MIARLIHFARDRRGAISVIAAAGGFLVLGFAALAIDLGSVFLQTRQLQGIADLAAVGAADNLGKAQAAAQATVDANGWRGPIQVQVVTGVYSPDPNLSPARRFSAGGATPNAAQVTLTADADLFFGAPLIGKQTVRISRSATAAAADAAAFSIGSGLASVQGGIENSLLTALTGSQVQLSAMDYNALVGADVDLLQFSQALQTSEHLQGVSFDRVLANNISTGQALTVLSGLLDTGGNDAAAQAITKIATAAGQSTPARLNQLIDLGPYGGQDHALPATGAGVQVSALQLTNAMLQLAQGGRQVQLSLGSSVPGLANVNAWLAIGQQPTNTAWLTVANDGSAIVSTAQARLYLQAQVAPSAGALASLGVGAVNIPIYVELASAQAKLSSISCASGSTPTSVTLSAAPAVGEIALGQIDTSKLNDFTTPMTVSPADLVYLAPPLLSRTPVLDVTGSSTINIGGGDWQDVVFNASEIQAHTVKTVSTTNIAQATIASLVAQASLSVKLLGVPVTIGALPTAVQSTLTTAASPLDDTLNALTALLGVKVGTASLWIDGVRCGDAALVA